MPHWTRSRDILSEIDELSFLEQGVINLAARLYTELRANQATFGEESIVNLVPHITSILSRLNDITRDNSELKEEIDSLKADLSAAELRCLDLNDSFKDKSVACCQLEDQYDADINNINCLLAKCREENASLRERLDLVPVLSDRLIIESQEKIDVLTAERRGLLTTIEVLEADIKCLRADLRRAETRAKQRRPSTCDDLLSELHAAEEAVSSPLSSVQPTCSTATTITVNQPTVNHLPSSPPTAPTTPSINNKEFKSVLLIGDSHVRHSSKDCADRGAFVECIPGGKILDVRNRLLSYLGVSIDVIYIHVGCNNLRKGYRGGPGYNGGHGKREALHAMADLLYTTKTNFPDAKVYLSSVLVRRDISYGALHSFNTQLELMCNNFNVELVEANSCVRRRDLSRDGVHFSRQAVTRLGSLFVKAITAAFQPLGEVVPPTQGVQRSEPTTQSGPSISSEPDPERVVEAPYSDISRVSGN